ncbi:hypothetical protein GMORB2_7618 [Geosmithia morbida]|uniref:Uncharacterized protein n=1 Tax=Geosmithia morbida TaxID=1094350 RepID=A0A9P4YSL8_9HYPO|nr:uncharacterized protein GMORB2_7618 [Geosmithia morbida]KAF4122025.1 hypothetical protein GMORB2_7618 [Geosmithia morbida]
MSAIALLSSVDGNIGDKGDPVDSEDECNVEEVAEDSPIRCIQGVHYPICIGDVLASRYRVEHRLGHGGFSTVSMADDAVNQYKARISENMPVKHRSQPIYNLARSIDLNTGNAMCSLCSSDNCSTTTTKYKQLWSAPEDDYA